MGGAMSRNKGQRGEREVIALLQNQVTLAYAAMRNEGYELGTEPRLQRNTIQSDRGGYDIAGLKWMALEVKFQETLHVDAWWKQTVEQSGKGQEPVLVYRQSRQPWRVCMWKPMTVGGGGSPTFEVCYRVQISIEDFLDYFYRSVMLRALVNTTQEQDSNADQV